MKNYNFIDLFAGCGGLSEGFLRTMQMNSIAHVEWESPMVDTLRNRLIKKWGYSLEDSMKSVIEFDMQRTQELIYGKWSAESINTYGKRNNAFITEFGLRSIVGDSSIDIIVGGPPCQAYSLAGRAQDRDSMQYDYRNYLFESFVELVSYFKPRVFVFENVPGILSAKPGGVSVLERIYEAFKEIGYDIRKPYEMKKSVYSSADFGVPQDRKRVIIFGVKHDSQLSVEDYYQSLDMLKNTDIKLTVRDAIGWLPRFTPLDKAIKVNGKNVSHKLIDNKVISLHQARYHNMRDIEVFKKWISDDMNKATARDKLLFYERVTGRTTNHNKYRSLEWDKPSPTIVSHLHKDGLMFIHPDIEQLRSITIREAALLQSFPIDYEFIGSTSYCFKMIGNAVPILFAEKIAKSIIRLWESK